MGNRSVLSQYIKDKTVLIVEPATNYRTSLRGFLSNLRMEKFRFAQNARDAQMAMVSSDVGLVICEWSLPDMNGLEFCRLLRRRKNSKDTPFLLMSSQNLSEDVILASEAGISSYLLKPFSFEEFQDSINNLLRGYYDPSNLNALLRCAESYFDKNEMGNARDAYKKALQVNSQSARAFLGLGRVALAEGDTESAMNRFRAALEANADFVEALSELLYLLLGREIDAEEFFDFSSRARDMSPNNPRYGLFLALAYSHRAEIEEVNRYLLGSIELSARLSQAIRTGDLKIPGGAVSNTFSVVSDKYKSLELSTRDTEVFRMLGEFYKGRLLNDWSLLCFTSAVIIDPSNKAHVERLADEYKALGDSAKYQECMDMLEDQWIHGEFAQ